MASFMSRYREALTLRHGWETPLTCPKCGTTAVPVMTGWKDRVGDPATVYANLTCSHCGADLRAAAATSLRETFTALPIPAANRRMLVTFVIGLVGGELLLIAIGAWGARSGVWPLKALPAFLAPSLLAGPAILFFNYRLASLRMTCACGAPAYKFMGMLGGSYCLRCSSCGRLLRMRD
jgi:hypothetical protein